MEDWSSAFGLHPHSDRYFVRCVQFSVVWKHHIAISTTSQLNGTWRETIGSVVWPHITEFCSWVLIWRDIPSTEYTTEWECSHRRRGTWNHHRYINASKYRWTTKSDICNNDIHFLPVEGFPGIIPAANEKQMIQNDLNCIVRSIRASKFVALSFSFASFLFLPYFC